MVGLKDADPLRKASDQIAGLAGLDDDKELSTRPGLIYPGLKDAEVKKKQDEQKGILKEGYDSFLHSLGPQNVRLFGAGIRSLGASLQIESIYDSGFEIEEYGAGMDWGEAASMPDIEGAESMARWMSGGLGQGLGSVGPPIAAGIAGGAAGFAVAGPPGAVVGSIMAGFTVNDIILAGEAYLQFEESGVDGYTAAKAAQYIAPLMASLDTLGLAKALRGTSRTASDSMLKYIGKQMAHGATVEAATEMAQGVVREITDASLSGDVKATERALAILEEGAIAGMTGGVLGGAASPFSPKPKSETGPEFRTGDRIKQPTVTGETKEVGELDKLEEGLPEEQPEPREGLKTEEGSQVLSTKEFDEYQEKFKQDVERRAEIRKAANEAATSPENTLPEPTEAQKAAGNYKKGHVNIAGLDVTIENPKGSTRSGTAPDGTEWSVEMPAHYGYIRRTEGKDAEQVDVYIGDNPDSDNVFIVDQVEPENNEFDEHKAFIGFDTLEEVNATYDAAFDDGSGPARRDGGITEMGVDEFKTWLKKEDTTKPIAEMDAEVTSLEDMEVGQVYYEKDPYSPESMRVFRKNEDGVVQSANAITYEEDGNKTKWFGSVPPQSIKPMSKIKPREKTEPKEVDSQEPFKGRAFHGGRVQPGQMPNVPNEGFFTSTDREFIEGGYLSGGNVFSEYEIDLKNPFRPDNDRHLSAQWVKDYIDFWREEDGWTNRYTGESMSDEEVYEMIANTELASYDSQYSNERWHDFLANAKEHHDGFVGRDPTESYDNPPEIVVAFNQESIKPVSGEQESVPETTETAIESAVDRAPINQPAKTAKPKEPAQPGQQTEPEEVLSKLSQEIIDPSREPVTKLDITAGRVQVYTEVIRNKLAAVADMSAKQFKGGRAEKEKLAVDGLIVSADDPTLTTKGREFALAAQSYNDALDTGIPVDWWLAPWRSSKLEGIGEGDAKGRPDKPGAVWNIPYGEHNASLSYWTNGSVIGTGFIPRGYRAVNSKEFVKKSGKGDLKMGKEMENYYFSEERRHGGSEIEPVAVQKKKGMKPSDPHTFWFKDENGNYAAISEQNFRFVEKEMGERPWTWRYHEGNNGKPGFFAAHHQPSKGIEIAVIEQETKAPANVVAAGEGQLVIGDPDKEKQPAPISVRFKVKGYHGSGERFDKFDMKFIGSGEGNQAFGWGLYMTEREEIAKMYRDQGTHGQPAKKTLVLPNGDSYERGFADGLPFEQVKDILDPDNKLTAEQYDVVVEAMEFAVLQGDVSPNDSIDADDMILILESALEERLELTKSGLRQVRIIEKDRPGFMERLSFEYENKIKLIEKAIEVVQPNIRKLEGTRLDVEAAGSLYEVEALIDQDEMLMWDRKFLHMPISVQVRVGRAMADDRITNIMPRILMDLKDEMRDFFRHSFAGRFRGGGVSDVSRQELVQAMKDDWIGETGYRDMKGDPDLTSEEAARDFLTYDQAQEVFKQKIWEPIMADMPEMTGKEIYEMISHSLGGDKDASLFLLDHGIKAVKYFDGFSRSVGKGSYNYVIFDDNLMNITARFKRPDLEHNPDIKTPQPKMSLQQVRDIVAKRSQKWDTARLPKITVLKNIGQLPEHIKKVVDPSFSYQGMAPKYPDGTVEVYLFSDELESAADVERVLSHEVIGHFSMQDMLGNEFDAVIKQVMGTRESRKVKPYWDMADKYYPDMSEEVKAEEVIAMMAETRAEHPIMTRVIAAIRRFLRNLGFRISYTYSEIRSMINRAERHMHKQENADQRMSMAAQDPDPVRQRVPDAVRMAFTAWAGSPATFDKFSTEYVGTGEGTENQGWGLYFSSIEGVAQWYKESLAPHFDGIPSQTYVKIGDNPNEYAFSGEGQRMAKEALDPNNEIEQIDDFNLFQRVWMQVLNEVTDNEAYIEAHVPVDEVIKQTFRELRQQPQAQLNNLDAYYAGDHPQERNEQRDIVAEQNRARAHRIIDQYNRAEEVLLRNLPDSGFSFYVERLQIDEGSVYQVELDLTEGTDMLDWDMRFIQMPEEMRNKIRDALPPSLFDSEYLVADQNDEMYGEELDEMTGSDIYWLMERFNTYQMGDGDHASKQASLGFLAAGIKGHQYISGSGNRNYVVYTDTAVAIANRYRREANLRSSGEPRLRATHSLSAENLEKALDRGTLIAPSVAITPDDVPHVWGGESSVDVVFKSGAINPRTWKVTEGDAWTPSHPSTVKIFKGTNQQRSQMGERLKKDLDALPAARRKKTDLSDFEFRYPDLVDDRGRIDEGNFRTAMEQIYQHQTRNRDRLYSERGQKWLEQYLEKITPPGAYIEESFFAGTTYTGAHRYLPATPENVLKDMRKQAKEDVVQFGGHGQIWARWRPKLTSITAIREAAGRIERDKKKYEKIKEEMAHEILDIARELSNAAGYHSVFGDEGLNILLNAGPHRDRIEWEVNRHRNRGEERFELSDILWEDIQNHFDKVRQMPIRFLEAKVIKEVPLSDVAAVISPPGMPRDMRRKLKKHGIAVKTKQPGMTNDELGALQSSPENVRFARGAPPHQPPPRKNQARIIDFKRPVESFFRMLTIPLGGIDAHGNMKYSKKMQEATRRILMETSPDENSFFGWLDAPLNTARHMWFNRYGTPKEFVVRDRKRAADQWQIMNELVGFLERIRDADMTTQQHEALQDILEGKELNDETMMELAAEVRESIDEYGKQLVDLGLLPEETWKSNLGTYLHRSYRDYEFNAPGLIQWGRKARAKRRMALRGDELKRRGMVHKFDPERIMKDIPPELREQAKQASSWRVMDQVNNDGRVLRRYYWPEGWNPALLTNSPPEPMSDSSFEIVDQGTWQVRHEKGRSGRQFLWRDYTKEERESMGEIRDARYNLIKTYELFAHDVANGKFFRDIAANPEWFRKDEPDVGDFIDATEATRGFATIANIEWVKVPSGNIEKTNVPRWGALAGGYVRAPIWRDLNELEKMQNPGYWGHILRFWKANKTARSPTVHFNNFVGNVILSELYDFTPGDLVRAMREYRQQGHLYQEAIQNGVFDSGYVRAELLGGSNARELIDQVIKEVEASEEIKMGSMWRLWEIITNANRKMERAYQWEDEIFRLVSFMHDKAMGMSTSEAAENAINRFMNYDIRAPLPNMLRKTVFPFLSYTYAFVPAWFKAVSNKPWKIAKVASIGYAIAALSDMLVEGEPEDERRVMSERETGVTWAGLPKTLRIPFATKDGDPMYMGLQRVLPGGGLTDADAGHVSGLPEWLLISGPMLMAGEMFLNRISYSGQDIVDQVDTGMEKTHKRMTYLWRATMPNAPWIPGSWNWQMLSRSINGETDIFGRNFSPVIAGVRQFGPKLYPFDYDVQLAYRMMDIDRDMREYRKKLWKLSMDKNNGKINDGAYRKGVQRVQEGMSRLAEKAAELRGGG